MKMVLFSVLALLSAGIAAEGVCRFALGLGAPPLSVADAKIEYMFAPNQDVVRFHNRFSTNEFGMRSPRYGVGDYERVILIFGDSVLNGGNLTDQTRLATTLLADRLSVEADQSVFVGNVSAGSWGVRNMLGWIETYTTLDADTLILVLNSGDVTDFPTFEPLNPNTHPTHRPPLALAELFQRYAPRLLPKGLFGQQEAGTAAPEQHAADEDIAHGQRDLEQFLDYAATAGLRVCLVQHLTQAELRTKPERGFAATGSVFEARGVPSLSLEAAFRSALEDGIQPYRDNIHISDEGHGLLADALFKCDREARIPGAIE